MSRVLLSCKSEYVFKMMEGKKKFEYRSKAFNENKKVDTIVVYATYPVSQILGEIKVGPIIKGTPYNIWNETNMYSGMSHESYIEYMAKINTEELKGNEYSTILNMILNPSSEMFSITKEQAKQSKLYSYMYKYFVDYVMAVGIEKFITYQRPKELREFGLNKPPQSYIYLDK